MMITSYFQSTYNSDKLAQTYLLASKVKAKLTQEAVRNDVDLHRLVCQANLLDNLIENLNNNENSNTSINYNSIEANPYPLLNSNIINNNHNNNSNDNNNNTVEINTYAIDGEVVDDEEDYYYEEDDGGEITIEKSNVSDTYYNSDDSDFESDIDVEEDDIDPNELPCLALERLNIQSGVEDDYNTENNLDEQIENFDSQSSHSVSYSDLESDDETDSDANVSDYFDDGYDESFNTINPCKLVRMHSQQSVLNLEHYVESVKSDVGKEIGRELEQLEETTGELNEIDHHHQHHDHDHEEDFPSLSNCSSLSSMEELKTVGHNIYKIDYSLDSKHFNNHIHHSSLETSNEEILIL